MVTETPIHRTRIKDSSIVEGPDHGFLFLAAIYIKRAARKKELKQNAQKSYFMLTMLSQVLVTTSHTLSWRQK